MAFFLFFVVWVSLLVFAGLPISIWAWLILIKNWNAIYVRKRKRILVATLLTMLTLGVFIGDTIGFVNIFIDSEMIKLVRVIIFFLPQQMLFWLLLIRFWLYFYDSYIITFHKTKDWRMAIDPQLDLKSNWFVKNINKWGNEMYLLKTITLVSILQVGLQFGVGYIISYSLSDQKAGDLASNIIYTFNYLLTLIPALYVFYQIKYEATATMVIDDNLGIKKDLLAITVSIVLIAIIATILRITVIYYQEDMIDIIRYYCYLFNSLGLIYFVGIYPKQLFDSYTNISTKHNSYKTKTRNNDNDENDKLLVLNMSGIHRITWKDLVCINQGYEAIMNHLEKGIFFCVCVWFSFYL